MPLAISVEDPRLSIRIVRIKSVLGPLGHLSGENVEVAIAIDIADLEAVAVDHVPADQVVAYPGLGILWVTPAFIPLERRGAIPGVDHHLRIRAASDESTGRNPATDIGNLDGSKATPLILEPVVAGQQV